MNKHIEKAENFIENKDFTNAIEEYLKAIEEKDYFACGALATFYFKGVGTDVDLDKANYYLNLGIENNDAICMAMKADILLKNNNEDEALSLYQKAAKLNNGHAIGMLGIVSFNNKNYNEAFNYFSKGSVLNDSTSFYYLYLMYKDGLGCEKSLDNAFYSIEACTEIYGDNPEFNYSLALCYYSGVGTSINYQKAYEIFSKTADYKDSKYYLGVMLKNGLGVEKDYNLAFEYLSSVQSLEASFELGLLNYYELSDKSIKNDSYFLFYACAMSKYAPSYIFIGECYYNGLEVKKDYEEAIKWYKKAYENDIKEASINIGCTYLKLKKYEEAINWLTIMKTKISFRALGEAYMKIKKYEEAFNSFQEGSNQGDVDSTYMLYKMSKKGKGCPKSKENAHIYYAKYMSLLNEELNK